jgi:NTE family protein
VFEPTRLPLDPDAPVAGGAPSPEAVLVDGGLASNFPVDVFDRTDGRRPRWPTIGVKLSEELNGPSSVQPVRGPIRFLRAVITTAVTSSDQVQLDDPCVVERTVFVDTSDVPPLDFDLDADTRARLATRGRAASAAWFDTWDEDAYLTRCRPRPTPADRRPPGRARRRA